MAITLIAIALLIAAGLVYGGIRLNAYSEKKYDYEPINFFTILAMTIPFLLLIAGFIFLHDIINQGLSIIFALIAAVMVFIYIQQKTDEEVALAATVILLFAGLILVMMASSTRRNYHYYDD